MSGLLRSKDSETPPDQAASDSLFIDGRRFANTAAKFWPSLIDEVREEFPDCTMIELSWPDSSHLDKNHLYPDISLRKNLHDLLDANLGDVINEAVAEFKILGPPPSVAVRLYNGEDEAFYGELPPDCVDADNFPFLVTWPLEWAGLPSEQWNDDFINGDLSAEDRNRNLVYKFVFSMTRRHLSEGLYQRSIYIESSVTRAAV